jgi:hypothetical protein
MWKFIHRGCGPLLLLLQPGSAYTALHAQERQATEDALNNLRVLEGEEERFAAGEKKRALEEALQKLRSLAPKFQQPE